MQPQEKSKLLARFEQVCAEKGDKIRFLDMAPVIEGFIEAIEDAINDNDRVVYNELKKISTNIRQLKQDLSTQYLGKNPADHIPGATLALGEVADCIESATNTILDTTEAIQGIAATIADKSQSDAIMNHTTRILEACNFQDLTGQRINKVLSTLEYIESATQKLLSLEAHTEEPAKPAAVASITNRAEQQKQGLLNGPQNAADAPSQDDIDKLFNSQ